MLKISDGFESGLRVKVADALKYCSEIAYLKEKYKDKIDIKIGFEMEYYEDMFDEMCEKAKELIQKYNLNYIGLISENKFFRQKVNLSLHLWQNMI